MEGQFCWCIPVENEEEKKRESLFNWSRSIITDPKRSSSLFLSFISLLSQLLVLLLFNSILTGIPIQIPIIIVAACEFEEDKDKVDSMEVQQASPPPGAGSFWATTTSSGAVPPLFEIQAAEVNQEDIWRELEQQEQPGGAKLRRPQICEGSPHWKIR